MSAPHDELRDAPIHHWDDASPDAERIFWCRRYPQGLGSSGLPAGVREKWWENPNLIPISLLPGIGLVMALFIAGTLAYVANVRISMSEVIDAVAALVVMLGCLGVVISAWIRRMRTRRFDARFSLPEWPDARARIVAVGTAQELGPLDIPRGVGFPPAVFWAGVSGILPLKSLKLAGPSTQAIVLLLLVITAVVLGLWSGWFDMQGFRQASPWLGGCGSIAVVIGILMRPMYLRVSPGRLDELHYSALRHRPLGSRSHDLKASKIVVDVRRWTIRISAGERASRYSLYLVPNRKRLARYVLMAALSTDRHPPAPEDALVG